LNAAVIELETATALLVESAFSSSDEAVEAAYSALRMAKVRFTSARAGFRENCQLSQVES
jgi:hypothetical protein